MEEIIKEELRPGEKILWRAKTDAFETLDVTHKKAFITKAALIIGIVAALYVVYVVFAQAKGIELKPVLVVGALFCAFLGAFNGISEGKKMKKMQYIVTDQRIISVLEVPKSLDFSHVREYEFMTDADGHTSVLFGKKAIKAKAHLRRTFALLDPYIDEETGYCSRFALYAVPDVDNLKKIFDEYIAK